MDPKTTKLLKQVVTDPATNVNQLNQLLPAMISAFAKAPKEVSDGFGQIVRAMVKAKIVDNKDLETLIMGEEIGKEAKEAKKFVITRFKVMMENLIEQANDEDKFDFISKVLLELHEEIYEGQTPD